MAATPLVLPVKSVPGARRQLAAMPDREARQLVGEHLFLALQALALHCEASTLDRLASTNTPLASALTGMMLVQDLSYLLELLEQPDALAAAASKTLATLVAAPDEPRATPFTPAARTALAAPTGTVSPDPALPTVTEGGDAASTTAPPARSSPPRRSPSQEPRGFPMGLSAYRALAPSLQRPTLRYHLYWAHRVNGEYVADELLDHLMARGENTVCGCLHDPQRLRGVIRSYCP